MHERARAVGHGAAVAAVVPGRPRHVRRRHRHRLRLRRSGLGSVPPRVNRACAPGPRLRGAGRGPCFAPFAVHYVIFSSFEARRSVARASVGAAVPSDQRQRAWETAPKVRRVPPRSSSAQTRLSRKRGKKSAPSLRRALPLFSQNRRAFPLSAHRLPVVHTAAPASCGTCSRSPSLQGRDVSLFPLPFP